MTFEDDDLDALLDALFGGKKDNPQPVEMPSVAMRLPAVVPQAGEASPVSRESLLGRAQNDLLMASLEEERRKNKDRWILGTRHIPFVGGLSEGYTAARAYLGAKRIESGEATVDDYKAVAKFQADQEWYNSLSTGGKIADALAYVPGLLAELGVSLGIGSLLSKGAQKAGTKVASQAVKDIVQRALSNKVAGTVIRSSPVMAGAFATNVAVHGPQQAFTEALTREDTGVGEAAARTVAREAISSVLTGFHVPGWSVKAADSVYEATKNVAKATLLNYGQAQAAKAVQNMAGLRDDMPELVEVWDDSGARERMLVELVTFGALNGVMGYGQTAMKMRSSGRRVQFEPQQVQENVEQSAAETVREAVGEPVERSSSQYLLYVIGKIQGGETPSVEDFEANVLRRTLSDGEKRALKSQVEQDMRKILSGTRASVRNIQDLNNLQPDDLLSRDMKDWSDRLIAAYRGLVEQVQEPEARSLLWFALKRASIGNELSSSEFVELEKNRQSHIGLRPPENILERALAPFQGTFSSVEDVYRFFRSVSDYAVERVSPSDPTRRYALQWSETDMKSLAKGVVPEGDVPLVQRAVELIHDAISEGKTPRLSRIAEMIGMGEDELWGYLSRLVRDKQPQSFDELVTSIRSQSEKQVWRVKNVETISDPEVVRIRTDAVMEKFRPVLDILNQNRPDAAWMLQRVIDRVAVNDPPARSDIARSISAEMVEGRFQSYEGDPSSRVRQLTDQVRTVLSNLAKNDPEYRRSANAVKSFTDLVEYVKSLANAAAMPPSAEIVPGGVPVLRRTGGQPEQPPAEQQPQTEQPQPPPQQPPEQPPGQSPPQPPDQPPDGTPPGRPPAPSQPEGSQTQQTPETQTAQAQPETTPEPAQQIETTQEPGQQGSSPTGKTPIERLAEIGSDATVSDVVRDHAVRLAALITNEKRTVQDLAYILFESAINGRPADPEVLSRDYNISSPDDLNEALGAIADRILPILAAVATPNVRPMEFKKEHLDVLQEANQRRLLEAISNAVAEGKELNINKIGRSANLRLGNLHRTFERAMERIREKFPEFEGVKTWEDFVQMVRRERGVLTQDVVTSGDEVSIRQKGSKLTKEERREAMLTELADSIMMFGITDVGVDPQNLRGSVDEVYKKIAAKIGMTQGESELSQEFVSRVRRAVKEIRKNAADAMKLIQENNVIAQESDTPETLADKIIGEGYSGDRETLVRKIADWVKVKTAGGSVDHLAEFYSFPLSLDMLENAGRMVLQFLGLDARIHQATGYTRQTSYADAPIMPSYDSFRSIVDSQLGSNKTSVYNFAITTWQLMRHVAGNMAKEFLKSLRPDADPFDYNPDGSVRLMNGRDIFLSDLVYEYHRAKANNQYYPVTPAEREALEMWFRIREKVLNQMTAEGMQVFLTEIGDEVPFSGLPEGYFPRPPAEPNYDPTSMRSFLTEEDGVRAGVSYVRGFFNRISYFLEQSYKLLADHRFITDPDVSAYDLYPSKLIAEMAKAQPTIDSMRALGVPSTLIEEYKKTIANLAHSRARGNLQDHKPFRRYYVPKVVRDAILPFLRKDKGPLRAASDLSRFLAGVVLSGDLGFLGLQFMGIFRYPRTALRVLKYLPRSFSEDGLVFKIAERRPDIREAIRDFSQSGGTIGDLSVMDYGIKTNQKTWYSKLLLPMEVLTRSMSNMLDLAKLEYYSMIRSSMYAQDADIPRLVEVVENIFGSSRPAWLRGWHPSWDLANRALFLAPAYYNSFKFLLRQAFTSGPAGYAARQHLATLAGITVLTPIAINLGLVAAGLMSEEDFEERLNPSRGKFATVPVSVAGRKFEVGFGGLMVSAMRSLATSLETDSAVQEVVGVRRAYRGHASVPVQILWSVATGRDYNGMPITPYEAIARAFIPLSLEPLTRSDIALEETAQMAGAQFFGLRAFPQSPFHAQLEQKRMLAYQMFGKRWDELTPVERAAVSVQVPPVEVRPQPPERLIRIRELGMLAESMRGHQLMKLLSDRVAKDLEQHNIVPTVSRNLRVGKADIVMSEDEQKEYIKRTAEIANSLWSLWTKEDIEGLQYKDRRDFLLGLLNRAKNVAEAEMIERKNLMERTSEANESQLKSLLRSALPFVPQSK